MTDAIEVVTLEDIHLKNPISDPDPQQNLMASEFVRNHKILFETF